MKIKTQAYFVEVENKYTHQFHKGFLVDAKDAGSVTQTIISICNVDPLSFDIKVSDISIEKANNFFEDKLPNGEPKYKTINEEMGVYEMVYSSIGNPYGD